jgi:hypothetical protein
MTDDDTTRTGAAAMKRCPGVDGRSCSTRIAADYYELCRWCFRKQQEQEQDEEPKVFDGTLAMKPRHQR